MGKSKKHKELNRFRFTPFSKHLKSIQFKLHRVTRDVGDDDSEETHYYQCLKKWNSIYCGEEFSKLYYTLSGCQTLELLASCYQNIVDLLLEHLSSCPMESVEPVLDLLSSLCDDIGRDVYKRYFIQILNVCIHLLEKPTENIVEVVFNHFARIIKRFRPYILEKREHMGKILENFYPLLQEKRPVYILDLATSSCAYVARCINHKEFLMQLVKLIEHHNDALVGCGRICAKIIEAPCNTFHKCTQEFVKSALECLFDNNSASRVPAIGQASQGSDKFIINLFQRIIIEITDFLTPDTVITSVWDPLMEFLEKNHSESNGTALCSLLESINCIVSLRIYCIPDKTRLLVILRHLCESATNSETRKQIEEKICDIIQSVLKKDAEFNEHHFASVCEVIESMGDISTKLESIQRLFVASKYRTNMLELGLIHISDLYKKENFSPKLIDFTVSLILEAKKFNILHEQSLNALSLEVSKTILNHILKPEMIHKQDYGHLVCSVIIGTYKKPLRAETIDIVNKLAKSQSVESHKNEITLFVSYAEAVTLLKINPPCQDIAGKSLECASKHSNTAAAVAAESMITKCGIDVTAAIVQNVRSLVSAPYHLARRSGLRILTHMDSSNAVYALMLKIENIHVYNENILHKLQQLRRLSFLDDHVPVWSDDITKRNDELRYVLEFLIGNLNISYADLWKPVCDIVVTHSCNNPHFWDVLKNHLLFSSAKVQRRTEEVEVCTGQIIKEDEDDEIWKLTDRPDFLNIHKLLWGILKRVINDIPDIDYVVTEFLTNVRDKYVANVLNRDIVCNIKKHEEISKHSENTRSFPAKLVSAYMEPFTQVEKFKVSPYEEKLVETFLILLKDKNPKIQKIALDALVQISGDNTVHKYKENLHNILDGNGIRKELELLKEIVSQHQEGLLFDVIIKLLYAEVFTAGKKTNRREVLSVFFGDMDPERIKTFVDFMFARCMLPPNCADVNDAICNVHISLNLEQIPDLRYLLNCLDALNILFEECGYAAHAVNLVTVLGVLVYGLFERREEIFPGYIRTVCKLRNKLYDTFLEYYVKIELPEDEVADIFKVFVFPYVEKLQIESVEQPSYLLKYLISCVTNPQYHRLMAQPAEVKQRSVIDVLIDMFKSSKTSNSVKKELIDIFDTLLSNEDLIVEEGSNRQHELLQRSQIEMLLSGLREFYRPKMKKQTLDKKDTDILRQVLTFVGCEEMNDDLLQLGTSITLKTVHSSNAELDTFRSYVSDSVQNVKDHKKFLQKMLSALSNTTDQAGRKVIFDLAAKVFRNVSKNILSSINSEELVANELMLEDFETDGSVIFEEGVFIVLYCFHIMEMENRNTYMARTYLRKISIAVCRKFSKSNEANFFVNNVLLGTIINGLSKSGDSKHTVITLLRDLAVKCASYHRVLKNISLLTDETGVDDFFENIQDVRNAREKRRALQKFNKIVNKLENDIERSTMTKIIYPLTKQFFCSPKYVNEHTLITEAVEAVKVICRLLPWNDYKIILLEWISIMRREMRYIKQTNRVVLNILDAFHFENRSERNDKLSSKKEVPIYQYSDNVQRFEENLSDVDDGNDVSKQKSINNQNVSERDNEETVLDDLEPVDTTSESQTEEKVKNEVRLLPIDRVAPMTSKQIDSLLNIVNKDLLAYFTNWITDESNPKDVFYNRKEAVLVVPLASVIVKLLKHLSPDRLDNILQRLFSGLCTYLKSGLQSVRLVTRQTIQNILLTVGPQYFSLLLSEMLPVLTKGFQLHVLVFTCHSILQSIKDSLRESDVDGVVEDLMKLCMKDLFGSLAEEREIGMSKVHEARTSKGRKLLRTLAETVGEKSINKLTEPLKQISTKTNEKRILKLITQCFSEISCGLVENKNHISTGTLLAIARCNKYADVVAQNRQTVQGHNVKPNQPNSLTLEVPSLRSGQSLEINAENHNYVTEEFRLEILYMLFKRGMLNDTVYDIVLNKNSAAIIESLNSRNNRTISLGLMCMSHLLNKNLPAVKERISSISETMFSLAHRFYGMDPDVAEDVLNVYRPLLNALCVLIGDVTYYRIKDDHLRLILLHIDEGIENTRLREMSLILLKVILRTGRTVAELQPVMKKVLDLSISCYQHNIRALCKRAVFLYISKYHVSNDVQSFLCAYIEALENPESSDSALCVILKIVKTCSADTLKKVSRYTLLKLATQIISQENADMYERCVKEIFVRLRDDVCENHIFQMTLNMAKAPQTKMKTGANCLHASFCKLKLLEREQANLVLEVTKKQLATGNNAKERRAIDEQYTYSIIHLVYVLESGYEISQQSKYRDFLGKAFDLACELVAYDSTKVRKRASQVIYKLLSSFPAKRIATHLNNEQKSSLGFIRCDIRSMLRKLTLDMCDQLTPTTGLVEPDLEFFESVKDNILLIIEILNYMNLKCENFSLLWLIKIIKKRIKNEIQQNAESTIVRKTVYRLFHEMVDKLKVNNLNSFLSTIFFILVKQKKMKNENGNEKIAELRNVAKGVLHYYAKVIPPSVYTEAVILAKEHIRQKELNAQQAKLEKRASGKRKRKKNSSEMDDVPRKTVCMADQ